MRTRALSATFALVAGFALVPPASASAQVVDDDGEVIRDEGGVPSTDQEEALERAGAGDAGAAASQEAEAAEPATSSMADARSDELLCDVIEDDDALTPAGARTLDAPGVREANNERRCMLVFGVDMPIEEVRSFYRSTLADRGFEIDEFLEGDGIARGNLSRTMIRASKPGLRVVVTVDEFDPAETSIAQYSIQAKLQIDTVGD